MGQHIAKQSLFWKILGFIYQEEMINFVRDHHTLYDRVCIDKQEVYVLDRLVDELKIDDNKLNERKNILSNKACVDPIDCLHFALIKFEQPTNVDNKYGIVESDIDVKSILLFE